MLNSIHGQCYECKEEIDLEDLLCPNCNNPDEKITLDDVQESIKYSLSCNACQDRDYTRFSEDVTEKEIEHYFSGMQRGRETALFWAAEFFGGEMVRFWENLEESMNGTKNDPDALKLHKD